MTDSFAGVFRGKRVFLTGHTGFKGGWLCEWLLALGAEVVGYALPPETRPALFDQLGLATRLAAHHEADIRDAATLAARLQECAPDFVFHLAAQPLVRESYARARETFDVNGMGTLYVLEALRGLSKPCAAVFVTTDKCYENREWVYGYREEDPLGGRDPYSASKAVAELIIHSYRQSFFPEGGPVKIASARAGNVIGGGDWAKDRIVPDCVRALDRGEAIVVRNKTATRPWQHVLEPLSGYLWLAAALAHPALARCPQPARLASGFNFGPTHEANRTVAELVGEVLKHWPGQWQDGSDPRAVHEANLFAAFHGQGAQFAGLVAGVDLFRGHRKNDWLVSSGGGRCRRQKLPAGVDARAGWRILPARPRVQPPVGHRQAARLEATPSPLP